MTYPNIDSRDFSYLISRKAEFHEFLDTGTLYPHQEIVRRYMSPYTPYKALLLYHSMGTGKTFTCISIAEDHYNYSGKRCIVLTKGQTSRVSYIMQIVQWLERTRTNVTKSEIKSYISSRYSFYHHISFCRHKLMTNVIDPALRDNIVLVIDEVHNINPSTGTIPTVMYEKLKSYILSLTNSRVLLLSGTPLVNDNRKILSILPMILPSNVEVDSNTLGNINVLRSVAKGYVSYYSGDTCAVTVNYIGSKILNTSRNICFSQMIDVQRSVYEELYNSKSKKDAIYSNSNSISLFVFNDRTYGSSIDSTNKILCKELVINSFIGAYMGDKRVNYKCKRYIVNETFKDDITRENLIKHSCKYDIIIREILSRTNQCCFVFIREVVGSGLLLFSAILEYLGYELYYGQDLSTISKRRRYTICVGNSEISSNNRDRISGFNHPDNKYGEYVQIMLGSSVMGESVSLHNVRHFHSISPHWNDSVIEQAIRRVIRTGSHNALNPKERTVDIFLHASYISNDIITVDMRKLHIAQDKESELVPLRNNLREISIESIFSTYHTNRIDLDCTTYYNYINDKILDIYVNDITKAIVSHAHIPISNISITLSLPKPLIHYILSKCLLYNIPVRDYYGRRGYIRESCGILSITRNITSNTNEIEPIPIIIYKDTISYTLTDTYNPMHFISKYINNNDYISIIRDMINLSWNQRISILETSININAPSLTHIYNIYIIDNNTHVYNYRKPTKGSYKSLLVGIRPKGLTRYNNIHTNTWDYMTSTDHESIILTKYNNKLDNIRETKSIDSCIYTLSTTDAILRVITIDNKYTDNRMYKRGRNISTLSKSEYNKCCISIVGNNCSTNELLNTLIYRGLLVYV